MRQNTKERIKTISIVLLSISAVALGLGTGLFDAPIRAGGLYTVIEEMRLAHPLRQEIAVPAAWPTTVMATAEPGLHRGYRLTGQEGNDSGPRLIYDLFSGSFGEALGSSGESVVVGQEAWERALTGPGIFFRYDVEVPGDVLARWFGVEPGGAVGLMELICLSVGPDTVYLYYMGRDGIPHRSPTALRPADIRESLEMLEPNGALYGFTQTEDIDPYTIFLPHYSGIPTLRESNAIGAVHGQRDAFLTSLGMNTALVRSLDEPGIRTIVEENATLRLYEDGLIRYQYLDTRPHIEEEPLDLAQAIEIARQIAGTLRLVSGEADIYLVDWVQDGAEFVLEFHYYIGGLPIWTDRPAATVILNGSQVTEVILLARYYARTEGFSSLIPKRQAAAAGGGSLILAYVPTMDPEGQQTQGIFTELRAAWLLGNRTGEGDGRG